MWALILCRMQRELECSTSEVQRTCRQFSLRLNFLQVQFFIFRNSIINSNRCFNFIRAILLLLCIPFVLILILLATILTIIGSTLFAILFSPCLSFMEYESYPRALFCFPCVGVYKIGVFIKRYVGTVCSVSCDFLGRFMMTIKALCCYDRRKFKSDSTKIQYVN